MFYRKNCSVRVAMQHKLFDCEQFIVAANISWNLMLRNLVNCTEITKNEV